MAWPKGRPRRVQTDQSYFAAAAPRRKPGRPRNPAKDPVVLQILCLYVVQKLGQGTVEQIQDKMTTALQLNVHQNTLEIALDALRKRGFLSLNHGSDDSGNRVSLFGIRNLKFQAAPEVAHVGDLLPQLLKTPEAEAIKAGLDAKEHQGKAKEKANRLGYRNYYSVRARFVTLDYLLGGMPMSPALERAIKASPYQIKSQAAPKKRGEDDEAQVRADLHFDRDGMDGAIVIPADHVKGWIQSNMRQADKGEVAKYISASAAKIHPPTGHFEQLVLPIINGGKGLGLARFEAIRAGVEFEVIFGVPQHGFLSPEEFHAFLMHAGLNPVRGLSSARGAKYGRVLLIAFEVIAQKGDVTPAIKAAIDNLPKDIQDKYREAIKESLSEIKGTSITSRGNGHLADDADATLQ